MNSLRFKRKFQQSKDIISNKNNILNSTDGSLLRYYQKSLLLIFLVIKYAHNNQIHTIYKLLILSIINFQCLILLLIFHTGSISLKKDMEHTKFVCRESIIQIRTQSSPSTAAIKTSNMGRCHFIIIMLHTHKMEKPLNKIDCEGKRRLTNRIFSVGGLNYTIILEENNNIIILEPVQQNAEYGGLLIKLFFSKK